MNAKFTLNVCRFIFLLASCLPSKAQNSVLVNFGANTCSGTAPAFSLIKNPLSGSPAALTNCDLSAQLPDYFSVFIAYNPSNNKVYVADISNGTETKIWLLNMGLPGTITCPPAIPVAPTYSYSYISNNFEFDNNGDLWSFSNYSDVTGQCNIDKFDVNTGNVLSSKVIQFPAGHFPTTIQSGDLTILPNGRMFAVLGNGICQLYEITGYNATPPATATATYLRTMPKDCYGIAYLNGLLELTGMDFGTNCYYYDYDIVTGTLGTEKPFQNGQAPIDNTSLTPQVGATKRLLNATKINASTADLVYEIYLENMGNVVLNNINLVDDLAATFGNGNVSNVSVSAVAGGNAANLTLNPLYNGTTVTSILNAGQNLPNKVLSNQNYFLKLELHCRASNLNATTTYFNSAIAKADIGAGSTATIISVLDSSNNGDQFVVDPNKNGNAADAGENVPTPFTMCTLPVRFINASATLQNNAALVNWQVATPMVNAAIFEVEFSTDGRRWSRAGVLSIDDNSRSNWQFTHPNVPTGALYYRIKQTDRDGSFTYSRILLLNNKKSGPAFVVYPNPANNFIAVSSGYQPAGNVAIELYDATGRLLVIRKMTAASEEINTEKYPRGTYLLRIVDDGNAVTYKVVVQH